MTLTIVNRNALPNEVEKQLLPNEDVFYFSYISYKGGCWSSSSRAEHWIALTGKRALYKAKVTEGEKIVEKEGVLPLEKISFIEVTKITDKEGCMGCNSKTNYALRLSTSGGTVSIPMPTKEKGDEIRNVFQHIIEEFQINQR